MPRKENKIYGYIENLYPLKAEVSAIRKTPKVELQEIQISAVEARVLQFLLNLINAKDVLEIGVLAGFSAAIIAEVLPTDGKLIAIEKDHSHFSLAQHNLAHYSNVQLVHADGIEALQSFADEKFDAIFIDANKNGYAEYLEFSYRVLKLGGLIIFDNTLMYGGVMDEKKNATCMVVDQFNRLLALDARFSSVIIPTDSGLTVARKVL